VPKLKPDTQIARRTNILDAAEQCFARAGFHRTTMQDICKGAEVSPGALYLYFDSKEALIAGLAERDRAAFAERIQFLASAPDFMAALAAIGEQYFAEEPAHKRLMCVEIGIEATRNPRVGEIHRCVDTFVRESFQALFQRLVDERRIDPVLDVTSLTQVFLTLGDGLFWRRAVDPSFDPKIVLPAVTQTLAGLLRPIPSDDAKIAVSDQMLQQSIDQPSEISSCV
jgi:TetR/AcrR family transcriptional regulator, repressor for uid operon